MSAAAKYVLDSHKSQKTAEIVEHGEVNYIGSYVIYKITKPSGKRWYLREWDNGRVGYVKESDLK